MSILMWSVGFSGLKPILLNMVCLGNLEGMLFKSVLLRDTYIFDLFCDWTEVLNGERLFLASDSL